MHMLIAAKRMALGAILAVGLSNGALAATRTLNGDHVSFTYDDTLVGLFGAPAVSGDTIYFTPDSFVASSSNGLPGLEFKNATLNIGIIANSGYQLTGVDFSEEGSYLLYQPVGSGLLGVELTGQMRVRDVASLAEKTGAIAPGAPMTTLGLPSRDWTATTSSSFAAWQSGAVNMTIENILIAYTTSAPSLAIVGTQYVGAGVLVTAVPEPETYAMLLAGLGLIGLVVRRRT
jgi:hypothetical protein